MHIISRVAVLNLSTVFRLLFLSVADVTIIYVCDRRSIIAVSWPYAVPPFGTRICAGQVGTRRCAEQVGTTLRAR